MKKSILIFFLLSNILVGLEAQALSDIETIRSRFFTDYTSSSHSSATATRTSMNANGSWSDLDYVNSFPITHLSRLNTMAGSYQTSSHIEYHSPAMLTAITNGLDYWCTNVFTFYYSNWFDFDIGQQDYLQKVLILMQGSISNTLLLKGCSLLSTQRPDPSWVEGQNLVWILGQKLHRGILLKDSADMRSALDSIQMQLDILKYSGHVQTSTATDGVGIQEDYSFFQHGAQFYNCGYGRSFLEDQIPYAIKVSGTTFAVSPNRLQVLSDLLLNTCKLYRNAWFHDYGEGRGIAIEGTTKNYMQPLLTLISTLLPANKPTYDALYKHIAGTGNKYSFLGNQFFWNGDFMVHQRSAYYASVRMCSNRTVGTESFSGDNRNGYWNPFGLQFITRNGTEYFNIFPLWKWSHVPGVTCPDTIPVFPSQNLNQTETFVGGVSDGNYGMSVLSVNKFSTTAKKTWFYFDKEIVALGAGITCTLAKTVNTTLNQCFLKSNVVADNVTLANGNEYSLTSPKWVLQDSIGYIFPQSSNVKVSNKSVTGSWSDVGQGSTTAITASVFSLWIDHGTKPTNATYQYIILPGVNQQGVSAYAAAIPVQVIANTNSIQAVRQTALNITQAAFYAKGNISIPNFIIDVDQPCLIMSKFVGDSMIISASNPVQSNLVLNVTVTAANSSKTLTFTFTKGSSCGKTQNKFILLKNGTEVSAYPQILPLNYKSFFSSSAMGTDSLVKVTYATYTLPILPNQWNNIAGSITPGSSTVENSTLSYLNYCDNKLGKAIVSDGNRRYAYYSLTSGTEYTGKSFYICALINFSAIKTGDAFMLFGKDYVGNYARGKLYPTSNGIGYSLGVQSSAETVVYGNTVLNFGTTYLVVLKITPSASGTEFLSVFVNPTIGGSEPVTPEATTSATPILTKIQSIGFRATPTGTIAGLRFSDNWADVVKKDTLTGLDNPINSIRISVSNNTIMTSETGTIQVYNLQGSKISEARDVSRLNTNLPNGLYILRLIHENGDLTTLKATIPN